jgi:protein FAM32A
MAPPAFTGGALSFKGEKSKKTKKKSQKSKHKIDNRLLNEVAAAIPTDDDDLTEAERKAQRFKEERAKQELESVAMKSHRERVEEFNEKLGNLTELNDIPRVSFIATTPLNDGFNSKLITLFLIIGQCCWKRIGIQLKRGLREEHLT